MTTPSVDPATLRARIESGDELKLVDVREPFEFAAERIDGALSCPLSDFDPAAIRKQCGDAPIVFYCRTGRRSADALRRFGGSGEVSHLAGGIEAWRAARLPTLRHASAPRLDVMRQVQVTAGSLVLAGVLLGVLVSPWFLIVSGFVGSGLMFAGLSGWCGMAKLLALLPWNRMPAA